MHIPGQRILNELRSEEAGIWYVPANNGEEIAILIKASTSILKSIIHGCDISFVFGQKNSFLCIGARIYDIPDSPVFTSNIQRHLEEHDALARFIDDKSAPLFLFNELDVCVAWADAYISDGSSEEISLILGDVKEKYTGSFTDQCSKALDDFCFSVDSTQKFDSATKIETLEIHVKRGDWTLTEISFAGNFESQTMALNEDDEGLVLEKSVWASLESVFPFGIYHSPIIRIGKKDRELTDVVTSYKYGSFLFEAKDLAVFTNGPERTRERRLKSIQKQTRKAIGQLVGASKAAKRGEQIFTKTGASLSLETNKPFHCIVLLTELPHEGDWSEIESQLRSAIFDTGDYFHVFDLQELIFLLKICRGKAELLDYNLMERCKLFFKKGSVHIRSRPAPVSESNTPEQQS